MWTKAICQYMKALLRMKGVTFVRSKDITIECANLKTTRISRTEGKFYPKSNASLYHSCEEHKFENLPHLKTPFIMQNKSRL